MSIAQKSKILASDASSLIAGLSISGKTITYTKADGTTGTLTTQDTTYSAATSSNLGLVKLSDSTSSTSAASAGIAATPQAVKTAYDLANSKQANLGFTPVQQGGGIGQLGNKVYIGWTGSQLKCTVDTTDIGAFLFSSNVSLPAGTVVAFAANSTPTGGFLLCNGANVSRTTYASLFAVIGTTYGEGDGLTTFNLPNLTDAKILTGSAVPVRGNGLTLGLTDGTTNYGIADTRSTSLKWSPLVSNNNVYGTNVGNTTAWSSKNRYASLGVTVDSAKSGIIADLSTAITMRYYIKY